jgi:hypothetical protein
MKIQEQNEKGKKYEKETRQRKISRKSIRRGCRKNKGRKISLLVLKNLEDTVIETGKMRVAMKNTGGGSRGKMFHRDNIFK